MRRISIETHKEAFFFGEKISNSNKREERVFSLQRQQTFSNLRDDFFNKTQSNFESTFDSKFEKNNVNKIPFITKSKFELNDDLDRNIQPTILFKNRINKIPSIRSTNLNIPSINQPNFQSNNKKFFLIKYSLFKTKY